MQCSLCNKVALRVVGKKGFCGTPMDVDGHYREAAREIQKTLKGKVFLFDLEEIRGTIRRGTRVRPDNRTHYFHA